VKLLLDMNLSPAWVPFLAQAGVDAVHWSSVGSATAPDREVMAWARAHDCIVFTNDLDFSALLAMTRETGPSVLQVRIQDLRPVSIGPLVVSALRDHAEALRQGAIVTIAEGGMRVRVLPLRA
jgi:predicted nuclease of predicted toxin-antitoxin system